MQTHHINPHDEDANKEDKCRSSLQIIKLWLYAKSRCCVINCGPCLLTCKSSDVQNGVH